MLRFTRPARFTRMKNPFYCSLLLLLVACNDPNPDIITPLRFQGFDGKTALVAPNETLKIKINQSVNWRSTGGTVSQGTNDTLSYTAPATAGMQQVVLKRPDNSPDSLVLTVAVTPKADLFKLLREGNYVLIFRHSAADVGSDQNNSTVAEWWKSCDSKLARQLNDQGVKEATQTGKTFRLLDLPVGRVLSSEFCRAFTSAEKMALGVLTQQLKELNYNVVPSDEASRCDNTLGLAANQPRDGKNSVFITHVALPMTQSDCSILNTLAWGEAALFALDANKSIRFVGRIPVKNWTELVN